MTVESTTNGKDNPPALSPLSLSIVEQGNMVHQQICDERDRFRDEVTRLNAALAESQVQVASLQEMARLHQEQAESVRDSFDAHVRSIEMSCELRITKYQGERDAAVDELAKYKHMFSSFFAQMREFGVPNVPLVRERDGTQEQ